jgi:hypothetical protein
VSAACRGFEARLGVRMAELARDRWAGFVFTDGLSGAEERVMDRLSDATNAAFVGGSAGDDLAFKVTHVCANGEAASDASVLALFEARRPFEIVKTQSFASRGSATSTRRRRCWSSVETTGPLRLARAGLPRGGRRRRDGGAGVRQGPSALGLDPDAPAVQVHDLLNDRETDPGPLARGVELLEEPEDPLVLARLDARAVVPHEEDRRPRRPTHPDLDARGAARAGETGGVVEQVLEDLHQAAPVPARATTDSFPGSSTWTPRAVTRPSTRASASRTRSPKGVSCVASASLPMREISSSSPRRRCIRSAASRTRLRSSGSRWSRPSETAFSIWPTKPWMVTRGARRSWDAV